MPNKRLFVIRGDIVSGTVKKGMIMKVRLNSDLSFDLPIDAVEMVKKAETSEVGLCMLCEDADELSLLKGFNIGDEIIEIHDATKNTTQLTSRYRQYGLNVRSE